MYFRVREGVLLDLCASQLYNSHLRSSLVLITPYQCQSLGPSSRLHLISRWQERCRAAHSNATKVGNHVSSDSGIAVWRKAAEVVCQKRLEMQAYR